MPDQIPVYQSNKILTAAQLNQMWRSMVALKLLGFISATGLPKPEFNLGDLTTIANGSLIGDLLAREGSGIKVYTALGVLVDEIEWEELMQATATNKGIVELATNAEIASGLAEALRPITPSALKSLFAGTAKNTNGYMRLPVGIGAGFEEMINEWGKYTGGVHGPTITFPLTFPNAVYNVVGTINAAAIVFGVTGTPGLSSFVGVQYDTGGGSTLEDFFWQAIGD